MESEGRPIRISADEMLQYLSCLGTLQYLSCLSVLFDQMFFWEAIFPTAQLAAGRKSGVRRMELEKTPCPDISWRNASTCALYGGAFRLDDD